MTPPGPDEPVQYETDIKPLFRPRDLQSMRFMFNLGSYRDISTHADRILVRLRAGSMPCDGAWPKDRVDLFERWIRTGKKP